MEFIEHSEFIKYQKARALIPDYKDSRKFSGLVNTFRGDLGAGLRREGRGFGYLKKRFPKGKIEISTRAQDCNGIDIVMTQIRGKNYGCDAEERFVQVGKDVEELKNKNSHYFLQVTPKKCYFKKGGFNVS